MKSAVLLLTVLYLSGCVNNPIDSNLENWEIHTASIENTQLRISIPPQPRVSKAASNYSSYDALDDQEVILFVGYDSPGLNPYVAPQFGVMVRAERDQSLGAEATPEDLARILADRYNQAAPGAIKGPRVPDDYEVVDVSGRTWLHIQSDSGAAWMTQINTHYFLAVMGLFGTQSSGNDAKRQTQLNVLADIVSLTEIRDFNQQ